MPKAKATSNYDRALTACIRSLGHRLAGDHCLEAGEIVRIFQSEWNLDTASCYRLQVEILSLERSWLQQ